MAEVLFYDGTCGYCHHSVKWLLARAPRAAEVRFAPLHGETFMARVPEDQQRNLPDSLVLLGEDGSLRTRSEAVLLLAKRLGGPYAFAAALGRILPRFLRDAAYDGIARIRHRLFARPNDPCPLLTPEQRKRFDP